MELADMIEPHDVLVDHRAVSKAELLRDLAHLAAGRTGIDETVILDLLTGRERLGSTGIGNGIAIPHANVPELGAPFTLLVRLKQPIDFEAIDEAPSAVLAKRGDDRERDRGFRGPRPAGRFGSGRGRERSDDREEFRARPRDEMDGPDGAGE